MFPGALAFLAFLDSEYTYVKSSFPPMSKKDPITNRTSAEAWMLIVEDLTKYRRYSKSPDNDVGCGGALYVYHACHGA